MAKTVCIIGAGSSGMTAAKACLEEGFSIIVYERSASIGGLWRYSDDSSNGLASVMKSTTINSSKEMTAFSDFPPEPHLANYMHHSKVIGYLENYCNTFNFTNYVKFNHEILRINPSIDYEITGKWKITIRNLSSNKIFDKIFDAVMICTGHHTKPKLPNFPGQNEYRGEIIHSGTYRRPAIFTDKRVVVVGIGNSGCDIASELSTLASQVYISTRRGSWILPKTLLYGLPIDSYYNRRITSLVLNVLPFNLACSIIEFFLDKILDHSKYHLKPKHRVMSAHGSVSGDLPNKILSGQVIVKSNIERFTEHGVIFLGDNMETLCDAVILATGYDLHFPFIDSELIRINNNKIDLYKYMIPPHLKQPTTLSFIGLIQPTGSIFTIAEIQCRWFVMLLTNDLKLPPKHLMVKNIEETNKKRFNQFYQSDRHNLELDWLSYMEDISSEIRVKPNLFKYFFTDPKLWWSLIFGPYVSYQFRLKGCHSWSGARNAILNVNNRICAPFCTRNDCNEPIHRQPYSK